MGIYIVLFLFALWVLGVFFFLFFGLKSFVKDKDHFISTKECHKLLRQVLSHFCELSESKRALLWEKKKDNQRILKAFSDSAVLYSCFMRSGIWRKQKQGAWGERRKQTHHNSKGKRQRFHCHREPHVA